VIQAIGCTIILLIASLRIKHLVRQILLILLLLLPGAFGIAFFGFYTLVDYDALQKAYQNYSAIVASSASMEKLFVAEAQQNIHRINVFADGVWTLQSAIIAAIGLHGILTSPRKPRGI
jgi:tellurite resistance protein TehA-like permease